MRRLLAGIAELFDLSQVNEWTVEVNPATASDEYCRMLRESGPDRLSFGAQSFDPAELAVLERHHNPLDVGRSIAAARAAGFTRLNLDLIYAVPGQTIESWQRSLEAALELEPPHLSCYGLTYEPNTPLAVRKRMGRVSAVEESLELAMMHLTRRRLADAGRPAYEISNFAIPGEECRHNLLYWTGGNYIGLGPAAASHVEGWRWRNRPHLGEWERAVADRQLPAIEAETLTPAARHGELAMLMLRLARGLNFSDFADRTGRDARKLFAEPIQRLVPNGLLSIDQTALRLTDRGLEVADAVAAEFLDALT
jgi:oxygen-independent coproporphyrinogen-3 oxidase